VRELLNSASSTLSRTTTYAATSLRPEDVFPAPPPPAPGSPRRGTSPPRDLRAPPDRRGRRAPPPRPARASGEGRGRGLLARRGGDPPRGLHDPHPDGEPRTPSRRRGPAPAQPGAHDEPARGCHGGGAGGVRGGGEQRGGKAVRVPGPARVTAAAAEPRVVQLTPSPAAREWGSVAVVTLPSVSVSTGAWQQADRGAPCGRCRTSPVCGHAHEAVLRGCERQPVIDARRTGAAYAGGTPSVGNRFALVGFVG
jgi:hypothetical protein